jgi:hypothetical protein
MQCTMLPLHHVRSLNSEHQMAVQAMVVVVGRRLLTATDKVRGNEPTMGSRVAKQQCETKKYPFDFILIKGLLLTATE